MVELRELSKGKITGRLLTDQEQTVKVGSGRETGNTVSVARRQ
jgi:hypothetical protein